MSPATVSLAAAAQLAAFVLYAAASDAQGARLSAATCLYSK